MFNVNHFIVSQVNPHVVPFLTQDDGPLLTQADSSSVEPEPGWLNSISNLARTEALHRMHVLTELGVLPNLFTKVSNVLSQRYSGDITIVPQVQYAQMLNVLKNPTTEYMVNAQLFGERATWPQVDRVRNHCAIELALDGAVHELRARIAMTGRSMDEKAETRKRTRTMSGGMAGTRLNGSRVPWGLQRHQSAAHVHMATRKKSASSAQLAERVEKYRDSSTHLSLRPSKSNESKQAPDHEFPFLSPGSATSSPSASDSDSDFANDIQDRKQDPSSSSDDALFDTTLNRTLSYTSQPPTPSHRMARLGYFGSTSPLAFRSSPPTVSPNISMSSSPAQSRVRLNEGRPGVSSKRNGVNRATSSSAVPTVSVGWGTRSRRALSTGVKGLTPPGPR